MIDKQDFVLSCSFITANAAITTLLGDWFIFLGGPHRVNVTDTISCDVYNKESYNLFGAICGVNMHDIEPVVTTLQVITALNLAFALLVFFLVSFRRMKRTFIKLSSLVILALSLTSVILWAVEDRERLPNDDTIINKYGAGWVAALVCTITTIPLFFI